MRGEEPVVKLDDCKRETFFRAPTEVEARGSG